MSLSVPLAPIPRRSCYYEEPNGCGSKSLSPIQDKVREPGLFNKPASAQMAAACCKLALRSIQANRL